MADPVSMSLDDYIKSQKKTGKMAFGRGGRGGGRRGPSSPRGGGAVAKVGGQNNFRGRKGRQSNNVQRRRGNNNVGGFRNRNNRQFAGAGPNFPRGNRLSGGGAGGNFGQVQGRRNSRRRNRNPKRQQRNSGLQQGNAGQGGANSVRYFRPNNVVAGPSGAQKRSLTRRLRLKRNVGVGINPTVGNQKVANKKAFMKLVKKRVQRAKLLVSRKNAVTASGKVKKLIAKRGRIALSKKGFVTVRDTKAKEMERALVQMKIARAQLARNRISPQQNANINVNLPGPSGGRRRNRARVVRAGNRTVSTGARAVEWNAPIVRTMTNDLADEMTSSHLNPEIQRKIAFIQSRGKGERAPVMPDFRAPVTTSRMKLSDRFRLLNDH